MKTIIYLSLLLFADRVLIAQPRFPADAIDLYAELKGKTILRSSGLSGLPNEVMSQALADTNNAGALIENALTNYHLQVIQDGDKFLRIMPDGWQDSFEGKYVSRIKPVSDKVPKPGNLSNHDAETYLPKGGINFYNVDINEVMKIYAEFRNVTILRPLVLPGSIRLHNQTPLTREEVVYAMTLVLALNGLAAFDDGDKFVQIVPVIQADQVKLHAPQPEKDSPLIEPPTIPSFQPGYFRPFRIPQPQAPPAGVQKAAGPPPLDSPAPNSTVNDLVAFYAKLIGVESIPDEPYGKFPIQFKATTPLTKTELLYALDTTLALNNLSIAHFGDNSIQATHLVQQR